jgi:hypothetical protein
LLCHDQDADIVRNGTRLGQELIIRDRQIRGVRVLQVVPQTSRIAVDLVA